ncbi:hypothetical protein CBR_g49429 [Chara braunii]|uniref:Reticulon-like protein n=1 Tax=Chara braunii TaxID=69332 RepID=A0A388M527_CHABU|nr:hypothetical protein CBR_g49429 [Chara braunii]|eukprot:GBG89640.1 hypothetical protein CBR_g49429 [Chara braunii]
MPIRIKVPHTKDEILAQQIFENTFICDDSGIPWSASNGTGQFGKSWIQRGISKITDLWNQELVQWRSAAELKTHLHHLRAVQERLHGIPNSIPATWKEILADPFAAYEGHWVVQGGPAAPSEVWKVEAILDQDYAAVAPYNLLEKEAREGFVLQAAEEKVVPLQRISSVVVCTKKARNGDEEFFCPMGVTPVGQLKVIPTALGTGSDYSFGPGSDYKSSHGFSEGSANSQRRFSERSKVQRRFKVSSTGSVIRAQAQPRFGEQGPGSGSAKKVQFGNPSTGSAKVQRRFSEQQPTACATNTYRLVEIGIAGIFGLLRLSDDVYGRDRYDLVHDRDRYDLVHDRDRPYGRWSGMAGTQSDMEWPDKDPDKVEFSHRHQGAIIVERGGGENGRRRRSRPMSRFRRLLSLRRLALFSRGSHQSGSRSPALLSDLSSRSLSSSFDTSDGTYGLECHYADLGQSILDILLWRRPMTTLLAVACGSLMYYHVVFRHRSMVSLIADVALVLACATVVLYHLSNLFSSSLKMDLAGKWELSEDSAYRITAFGANTIGAAEGVMRIAANGSDYKLFVKVMIALCSMSLIGRVVSGPTFIFICMWMLFTIPVILSWVGIETDLCFGRRPLLLGNIYRSPTGSSRSTAFPIIESSRALDVHAHADAATDDDDDDDDDDDGHDDDDDGFLDHDDNHRSDSYSPDPYNLDSQSLNPYSLDAYNLGPYSLDPPYGPDPKSY